MQFIKILLNIINWGKLLFLCCNRTSATTECCSTFISQEWLDKVVVFCKGPDWSKDSSGQWGHFLDIEKIEDEKEIYLIKNI